MSEPLESEAGEDPGTLAIKRTRIGYAPALVGSRPSQVMSLPAEEPASTADMVPEIAAAAAATATGPHQTIVTPRFGGVLRKRDTKAMGPPVGTRLPLVPGKLIPGTRYRLVRWLGEGGMGVVYEAEHIDIERHVALKILRFDLSQQPEMVQVFRDEARAASRMGHPNVVEIFDFGELPDGRLFICMEMLAGADLVPDVNALPDHGALIATLVALGFHILVFWYAEKIVLKLHDAREVGSDDPSPMIRAFVADCDRLAMRANMPRPRTYIVDAFQPNAFSSERRTR